MDVAKKEKKIYERNWILSKSNPIRTKYVQTKMDWIEQNSKCRLSGDRVEMINHN